MCDSWQRLLGAADDGLVRWLPLTPSGKSPEEGNIGFCSFRTFCDRVENKPNFSEMRGLAIPSNLRRHVLRAHIYQVPVCDCWGLVDCPPFVGVFCRWTTRAPPAFSYVDYGSLDIHNPNPDTHFHHPRPPQAHNLPALAETARALRVEVQCGPMTAAVKGVGGSSAPAWYETLQIEIDLPPGDADARARGSWDLAPPLVIRVLDGDRLVGQALPVPLSTVWSSFDNKFVFAVDGVCLC